MAWIDTVFAGNATQINADIYKIILCVGREKETAQRFSKSLRQSAKKQVDLLAGDEFAPVELGDAAHHVRDLFFREFGLGGGMFFESSQNSFADEFVFGATQTCCHRLEFGIKLVGNLNGGHGRLAVESIAES